MLPKDAAFSLANVLGAGAVLPPDTPLAWTSLPPGPGYTWGELCVLWVSSLLAALPGRRDALDGGPNLAPAAACFLVPRQGLPGRQCPGAAPAQLYTETLGRTLLRAGAGQRGGLD